VSGEVEISVVVPVCDEAGNVAPLAAEIRAALDGTGRPYELIFVDDGSGDATAARCASLPGVRCLRHASRLGQSAAILTGIEAARGAWIVTLDGDGQNDPASIPRLLDALKDADAAVGFRTRRHDPLGRRLAARLAGGLRRLVLRDGIADVGCALRAFPREEALRLPRFDGVHRVLPALLVLRGLSVAQVPTHHRPRVAGVSKYGNRERALRGLLDLVGLWWWRRRVLRDPASGLRRDR
jgi:dolichol-phosphate mannosyltransferase